MNQSLKSDLLANTSLSLINHVFYGLHAPKAAFENTYIQLRMKENRLYDDEVVKHLPSFPPYHMLHEEWDVRKMSLDRLSRHLARHKFLTTILEIGCGNGWMTRHLASGKNEVCAIDINEKELLQAARLFSSDNISFIYGDIFSIPLAKKRFDVVILSGSIQYFQKPDMLLERLLELTRAKGEIHILDSPFYEKGQVSEARKRSEDYFGSLGMPEMGSYYFHHSYQVLNNFNWSFLFDPASPYERLMHGVLQKRRSPFPWIRIKAE